MTKDPARRARSAGQEILHGATSVWPYDSYTNLEVLLKKRGLLGYDWGKDDHT